MIKRLTPKETKSAAKPKLMTMKEYEKSPEDKKADKKELARVNAKRRQTRDNGH